MSVCGHDVHLLPLIIYRLSTYLVFLLFLVKTGLCEMSGFSCYGEAQVRCFSNITVLVVLLQRPPPNGYTDVCSAFYKARDCLTPHVARCDKLGRELFLHDMMSTMTNAPYNCHNDTKINDQVNKGVAEGRHDQSSSNCITACHILIGALLVTHILHYQVFKKAIS